MEQRSFELNQAVLGKTLGRPDVEWELAANDADLAVLLAMAGLRSDRLWIQRKPLERIRGLIARYPDRLLYQQKLLLSLMNLACAEWDCGLKDQAIVSAGEGLTLSRQLAAAHPDVPFPPLMRFRAAALIGGWREERGEPYDEVDEEALAAFPVSGDPNQNNLSLDLRSFVGTADRRIGSLSKPRSPLTAAEQSQIETVGSRAVSLLARAADLGDVGLVNLKNPSRWPNLRKRDDFRALVRRLEEGRPGVAAEAAGAAVANAAPVAPTARELDFRARSERADSRLAAAVLLSELGRREESGRRLEQARGELEALIRDDPKSPDHRFDLSRALRVGADHANEDGRLHEALRGWIAARDLQLGLAANLESDWTSVASCRVDLLDLGRTFCDRGLWVEADAALEPALAAAKNADTGIDLMAGLTRLLLRDEVGYRRIRDRALSRHVASDSAQATADLAMLAGIAPDSDVDRAALIPLAMRGLEVTGQHWPEVYLALSYLRAGRLEEVKDQLDLYDRARPPDVGPVDDLAALADAVRAMLLHRMGRVVESRHALTKSRRKLDDLGMQFLEWPLSAPRVGFGFWAAARVLVSEAVAEIEGRPRRPDPWTDLMNAWAESQFGRPDRARAALGRIAPEEVIRASVTAARAHVLLSLGDRDRARQDLESAIRIEPESFLTWITRGRLALAERQPDAAADNLLQALARCPDSRNEEGLRVVIDRLFAADDAVFARAVALRPSDPQLWVTRGRHLAWLGRWKDAADAFGRGISSGPPAEDWFEYGALLLLAGDQLSYRRLCERIADQVKQPGSDRDWFMPYLAARLSRCSASSGVAPEVAIGWVNAARRLKPDNAWLDHLAGAARLGVRDQDEAALRLLISATRRMRWGSGVGVTWYALAILHRRLGQDADAALARAGRGLDGRP